ncbi:hypothetical protein [Streptomyces sp. NPDC054995]
MKKQTRYVRGTAGAAVLGMAVLLGPVAGPAAAADQENVTLFSTVPSPTQDAQLVLAAEGSSAVLADLDEANPAQRWTISDHRDDDGSYARIKHSSGQCLTSHDDDTVALQPCSSGGDGYEYDEELSERENIQRANQAQVLKEHQMWDITRHWVVWSIRPVISDSTEEMRGKCLHALGAERSVDLADCGGDGDRDTWVNPTAA